MNPIKMALDKKHNAMAILQEQNPNDLIVPTDMIILPVDVEAFLLEHKLEDKLKPVKPGMYREGAMYPVKEPQQSPLMHHYLDYVSNRLSEMDEKENNLLKKKPRLYTAPTVPTRGLQLIELCIGNEINKINPFSTNQHSRILFDRLFVEPDNQQEDEDDVDYMDSVVIACDQILHQLLAFIGNDVWHIYFVKFVGTNLKIIKTIDYRIYDWHMQRFNQAIASLED